MSWHWNTFFIRSLSAIVFVAIMLTGMFSSVYMFTGLFVIIAMGCSVEAKRLWRAFSPAYQLLSSIHIYLMQLVGLLFIVVLNPFVFHLPSGIYSLCVDIWLLLMVIAFCIEILYFKKANMYSFIQSILSTAYTFVPCGLMIYLYTVSVAMKITATHYIHFAVIPLIIILTNWLNDTFAYMVGSMIGKTPLTRISPKKTWEGTVAGIIISVVMVTYMMHRWFNWQLLYGLRYVFLLSYFTAISGVIGDILESKLKRLAGVKDSGTMMPGHGGFLDRFDSVLFSTPVAFLLWYWVLNV